MLAGTTFSRKNFKAVGVVHPKESPNSVLKEEQTLRGSFMRAPN